MKKLSLLVVMLVVLLSVFAIEVSAEYYINEEFTTDISGVTVSGNGVHEWEDGSLHGGASGENLSLNVYASETILPKNLTACFDYKLDSRAATSFRPIINVYGGFGRASLSTTLAWMKVNGTDYATLSATADTWYSVMVQFKPSGESIVFDLYRRKRDTDEPYKKYISDLPIQTNEGDAQLQIYGTNWEANIDNIKYYTGTFSNGTSFEFNGSPIESVSSIGNGTLKVTTEVVSNKIVLGADDKIIPAKGTPVLVFYNKNGRLISCSFIQDNDLIVGKENAIELTVDTSSFYNKLDGGYGALYIIDDFENLQLIAETIEL